MKKYFFLFLIFLINSSRVLALDIVYPKKNPVTINASSTFFIGSTNPTDTLTINGFEVKVSPLGAFAQVVPLNTGKNEFKIISQSKEEGKDETINFVIEKPLPKTSTYTPPVLIEYPMMSDFFVKADNTPMRTTPVDSGINRMSHLQQGMPVLINGEKNGFYRIYLNSKICGWIDKNHVEQKPNSQISPVTSPIKITNFTPSEDKEFTYYKFDLENPTTFSVKEENGLTVQLFNINADKIDFKNLNACTEDNTLNISIPQEKLFGYDTYYETNTFVVKVRKELKINGKRPLKNITIAVDAGHGGDEYGAIGCSGDKEKDINLAIAKNLQKELEERGAKVVTTREKDTTLSLNDRVKIAKDNDAVLSLSIHANAIPDGGDPMKNRGTSVYYYHNQAKPLAESILNSITTQVCTQNDKVRQASLALVRPTSAVSVLIEVAYIINPDDYAMLLDKDFQLNCAKAIADGIESYILDFPTIPFSSSRTK